MDDRVKHILNKMTSTVKNEVADVTTSFTKKLTNNDDDSSLYKKMIKSGKNLYNAAKEELKSFENGSNRQISNSGMISGLVIIMNLFLYFNY